jgi:F1F0 ATPase subunit 2
MKDNLFLVLVFIAGIALGLLFFGGLWFTVKKITTAKKPSLLFLGSFFLRFGITIFGFYFFSSGRWQSFLVCLLGFITARVLIIHITKSGKEKLIRLKKDHSHET